MKAVRIWPQDLFGKDLHVNFYHRFSLPNPAQKTELRLSCDGMFSFTVNGKLAGFGAPQNYPENKKYLRFDLSAFVRAENELVISVWHPGIDSQTYKADEPYLAFDVRADGKTVAQGDKTTLAALDRHYKNGYAKKITNQLGLSFAYDANAGEDIPKPASEIGTVTLTRHKVDNLVLGGRPPVKLTKTDFGYLCDMGRETVGFLELEVKNLVPAPLVLTYGEHLDADGRVPRYIGNRDFSLEYTAAPGHATFMNAQRRVAGRYLEVIGKAEVLYVGIRPVTLPKTEIPRRFEDATYQALYDMGVRTLSCCMHEHYEDCPWREQALYTMDSRNQMLCGYTAFAGTGYQKANLLLIAQGQRKDGLLDLCFPAGVSYPIPFFSLIYPHQVCEYIKNSGDPGILQTLKPTLAALREAFLSRMDESGLLTDFPSPFWNFYEWNEFGSAASEIGEVGRDTRGKYHVILNAMWEYTAPVLDALLGTKTDLTGHFAALEAAFYDESTGAYVNRPGEKEKSLLGNALALLAGHGDEGLAERLSSAPEDFDFLTLSMTSFLYDAWQKRIPARAKDMILSDIRARYSPMLGGESGTFWETEKGASDFDGAGSLCHGWSALPVYYLAKLAPHTCPKRG